MIRINLLGAQKGKNKRSAASAAAVMEVGDVGSPKMKVLVVLVLAGLVNVGYWYQLDKQHRDIAAKMEVAVRKNANWPTSRHATWSASAKPKTTSAGWT